MYNVNYYYYYYVIRILQYYYFLWVGTNFTYTLLYNLLKPVGYVMHQQV